MASSRLQALKESSRAATLAQENVEKWQVDNNALFAAEQQPGIIGLLFDASMICLNGVLGVLRQQDIKRQTYRDLEKHAAALLFWGSDHGVACGNLDRALQHSEFLRDAVLLVLISIGETIYQG